MSENKYSNVPLQMNLELTTKCPLHCPQCYVSLNTGREMPLETALYWIRDAASCGVRSVNLSGGETLCYPYLTELIKECHKLKLYCNVALSGVYVTGKKLDELMECGVTGIFVSLNGSTKEINEKTRDGYIPAIQTLELLRKVRFPYTIINWVMHACNADDFPAMISLAENYEVFGLTVIAFKPDSSHEMKSYPSKRQIEAVSKKIREYIGPVKLNAEPCFSQLRTLIKETFYGSANYGLFRGCGAGRYSISVTTEGTLTPCRHLDVEEKFEHIADYWNHSEFLKKLRLVEEKRQSPCRGCRFETNCLPCHAAGMKLHGGLTYNMTECPLQTVEAGDVNPND